MRAIAALALLLACGPAIAGDGDAAAVVSRFYSTCQGIARGGIPAPLDMARLEPFLTSRLRDLLAQARRFQADYGRRFPEDRPPFVDGDLFSSNFEGFKAFSLGGVERRPDGSQRVTVQLSYWDAGRPDEIVRWQDAVLVVESQGTLLIDDIEFLGDWPFARKGLLSDALRARD